MDSLESFKEEILKHDDIEIFESIQRVHVNFKMFGIDQFEIKCPYNDKIQQIISSFKNKYWSRDLKVWHLPVSIFDYFNRKISSIPDVKIVNYE